MEYKDMPVDKLLWNTRMYPGCVSASESAAELGRRLADAQATVEALQKKYDDLLGKYHQLVDFYDKHNGTPCEQIRHQQQVDALQRVRDEFERERDQLHAALMEAKAALDAERERVRQNLLTIMDLQTQLSQLQAAGNAMMKALRAMRDNKESWYTTVTPELMNAWDMMKASLGTRHPGRHVQSRRE